MLLRACSLSLLALAVACGATAEPSNSTRPNDTSTCADCQPNDGSAGLAQAAGAHCSDPAQAAASETTSSDLSKLIVGRWISCEKSDDPRAVFSKLGVEFYADGTWRIINYNLIGDVGPSGNSGKWRVGTTGAQVADAGPQAGTLDVQLELPPEALADTASVEITFEANASRMRTVEAGSGIVATFVPWR